MKHDVDALLNNWHAPAPDVHFEARVIQHAYRTPTLQEQRTSWLRHTAAALLLFVGGTFAGSFIEPAAENQTIALFSTEEEDLWTL